MTDWTTTRAAIIADRARFRAVLAAEPGGRLGRLPEAGFLAVLIYRLAHWLRARGWRVTGRLLWLANITLTGADIDIRSSIGPGLVLRHPRACAIHGRVGANCTF